MDQIASTAMLKIKFVHNLVADLEALKYNPNIRPLKECLKYSPLMKVLSMFEKVPLFLLSQAYSTAIYHSTEEVINYDVLGHKTSISKVHFCKLLGFYSYPDVIHPDSVAIYRLFTMFNQMGYNSDCTLLSKFKKSSLPLVWNALLLFFLRVYQKGLLVLIVRTIFSTP